jgi:hypothetical protein
MSETELFHRMGVALAIGLLIGLERGWKMREAGEGERAAGLRTFALTGLLGGVSGALAAAASTLLLAPALIVFAAAFILFSWREAVSMARWARPQWWRDCSPSCSAPMRCWAISVSRWPLRSPWRCCWP